jgi:hypothetical protein
VVDGELICLPIVRKNPSNEKSRGCRKANNNWPDLTVRNPAAINNKIPYEQCEDDNTKRYRQVPSGTL